MEPIYFHSKWVSGLVGSRGLMDRVLDLKPEVTQGCGFESRLRQEVHDCSWVLHSRLPTAPGVCALGWVKCREHISLLNILCIIVYVTNKALLSLICICFHTMEVSGSFLA